MSAILEALKKLEQEAAEPSGHPLWPETRQDRGRRWMSLAGGLLISVVLFALAGYGVVVLTGKIQTTRVSETSRSSGAKSLVSPPADAVAKIRHVQPEKPLPPSAAVRVQTPSPAANQEDVVAVVLEDGNLPEETVTTAPPLPPAPKENAWEEKPGPENSSDSGRISAGDVIQDTEVALQAISWSSDANRRMAVINGKICREKEQIEGYLIIAINPDDVLVAKGSVQGRLVFNNR